MIEPTPKSETEVKPAPLIERRRVADIVNARLSEEELVAVLLEISSQPLSADLMRLFIEETRKTVVGKDELPAGTGLIDVSGTGGSGLAHFNTSTFCAFVLAAGGVNVAKFGNRASRSGAGSADLLEAMGIPLNLPSARVGDVLEAAGVAFLFAPHYYPGLKKLAAARKAVGQPTIFNHIGPLLNPIEPEYRVFGMSSQAVTLRAAEVLKESHARALIVTSQLGLDELMPGAFNHVLLVNQGAVSDISFAASGASLYDGRDGKQLRFDLQHNKNLFSRLLETRSKTESQPWLDLVCLNSGAGFFVAGAADSIESGAEMARELIVCGGVKEKFNAVRRVYEKCAA
ncbi:MAG TPA: anthranilate phosphoribosyltransferase [Candidatus Melainabacteria bacterium]|jgi:anthranilate phosphoribosyltransferase|nr:anthranilate phosphoribosyltransferase [Candidatus Melainabacteria bacterium]